MECTNDKVISLIELYRNWPVLWDCRLKAYKDRNKRHDALMEIAVSFGVGEEEVEITTRHSEKVPETTSTSVLEIQLVRIVQY
jgi:hypothetical protein